MARGSRKAFVLITTGMSNKRRRSSGTVGGVTILESWLWRFRRGGGAGGAVRGLITSRENVTPTQGQSSRIYCSSVPQPAVVAPV